MQVSLFFMAPITIFFFDAFLQVRSPSCFFLLLHFSRVKTCLVAVASAGACIRNLREGPVGYVRPTSRVETRPVGVATLKPRVERYSKSVILKYKPSSESLHISVK